MCWEGDWSGIHGVHLSAVYQGTKSWGGVDILVIDHFSILHFGRCAPGELG